ncbi:hypothetical protein YC2023_034393 [Brassica napus]
MQRGTSPVEVNNKSERKHNESQRVLEIVGREADGGRRCIPVGCVTDLHNEKAEVDKKYNFSLFIEKEVLVLKSVNH